MRRNFVRRQRLARSRSDKRENKLWTILNSSIIIWLLTAVAGTVVTFTYTNLQGCLKDAEVKATRANSVYAEIIDRRVDILYAIKDANSLPDLAARMKKLGYIRYEFKDVPLQSLTAELKQFQMITRKLPFAEELGRLSINASHLTEDDLPYIELLSGGTVDGRPEDYFVGLKAALPRLAQYVTTEQTFAATFALVPYCTVGGAFTSMWRARDRILEFRDFETPREAPFIALPPGKKSS